MEDILRKSLTKSELEIIADLLSLAAEDFEKADCDDYVLNPTEENKNIALKVLEDNAVFKFESDIEAIVYEKDEILCQTAQLMDYFAKRCKKLSLK